MKQHSCKTCRFRARYDADRTSLLGRLWRWHANFCPGWKRYITSLPEDERIRLAASYKMEKYARPGT